MRRVGAIAVRMFHRVVEFIFPSACPVCGAPVSVHGELCGDCWASFNWICRPYCNVCGYPFPSDLDLSDTVMCPVCAARDSAVEWMRSACVYDDMSRSVMLPFKHGGKIKYSYFMSRAMIWALRDMSADVDIVMPVPLARRRLVHRTYNQAALLARPIAHAMRRPMDVASVHRAHRPDMGHMTPKQRAENIRGVFTVVHPDRIQGRVILLVDDVFTSGATFRELRRVLMRAGARAVYGVTFCRVVRA